MDTFTKLPPHGFCFAGSAFNKRPSFTSLMSKPAKWNWWGESFVTPSGSWGVEFKLWYYRNRVSKETARVLSRSMEILQNNFQKKWKNVNKNLWKCKKWKTVNKSDSSAKSYTQENASRKKKKKELCSAP